MQLDPILKLSLTLPESIHSGCLSQGSKEVGIDRGQSLFPGTGALGEGGGMKLQKQFWGELKGGKEWHSMKSPRVFPDSSDS